MDLFTLKQVSESVYTQASQWVCLHLDIFVGLFTLKQVSESAYIQAGQWVCLHSSRPLSLSTLKQVSNVFKADGPRVDYS